MSKQEKRILKLLFAAAAVVVLMGMFVPVMEVDAAQYASISKQMWQEKSFLKIYHRDLNYLDKPPLLFWLSGLCMGVLGFNNFAYKLPSVLFSVLGVWSTFRLSRHYYGERVAWWSALMYATSVAFFIFNNDIRTDTLLINLLVFSVQQLTEFRFTGKKKYFLLAFVGIGLGMLAKGPLGLVFPALAIGGDVLMHRDWKFLFKPIWLLGLVIIALILLPMCIGLYQQFDSDPTAWVNGEKGVSGLHFYFWTQSFGRLTGDSIWATQYSNNPGPFFLTTTFLWAFLPWTPLYVYGFFKRLIQLFRQKFKAESNQEWISFFAFLLPLLALSKSGYQLNHYIYLVIPFTSMLAAKVLVDFRNARNAWILVWRGFSLLFFFSVLAICGWIMLRVFPVHGAWLVLLILPVTLLILKRVEFRVSMALAAGVIFCFGVLNACFYPRLLNYQRGKYVSNLYEEVRKENSKLYIYKTGVSHALDFYQDHWVPGYGFEHSDSLNQIEHLYVYTNKAGLKVMDDNHIGYEVIESMDYYPVTKLTLGFLNPDTRSAFTRKRYLIKMAN